MTRVIRSLCLSLLPTACTGKTLDLGHNGPAITLDPASVVVPQDATKSGPIHVSMVDFPDYVTSVTTSVPGVLASFAGGPGGGEGNLSFHAALADAGPAAGFYGNATVTFNSGTETAIATLSSINVAVVPVVGATPDPSLGVGGKLEEFMSTSFQPAPWQWQFFSTYPDTTDLENLGSQHIHIQAYDMAVPWRTQSVPPSASDWDFTELDAMVGKIGSVGDHSPLFQIAVAPSFVGTLDGSVPEYLDAFATYAANLVRYYNKGGFTYAGKLFARPAGTKPITWWGIFGDYNVHQLSANEYVTLYARTVRAMLAVDPTLKFSAFEYTDYLLNQQVKPMGDLKEFLQGVSAASTDGGVLPVNAVSFHIFSTPDVQSTDVSVMKTVPVYSADLASAVSAIAAYSAPLPPVWVTENNVNSDVPLADGTSQFYSGLPFLNDVRGTSPFFAAWRPYVFSMFGKAGNRALYHWDYTAGHITGPVDLDTQSAEVDYTTGTKFLSYWVDYWLARMFPSTDTSSTLGILPVSGVGSDASIEVLATKNASDGSVVVMVVDWAPEDQKVVKGSGAPRTAIVDVSSFPVFSSGSIRAIPGNPDPTMAPIAIGPADLRARRLQVDLAGYGVAFLKLTP